ncbi:AMED_5909 family protein [Actinokineospora sp.]|uniref:AMED_5909 family protein n=1 Tax=Actinokineospora sp. TaxID=1872133 RepID=UPI003D6C6108
MPRPTMPKTLSQTHELVMRFRPAYTASPAEWKAFREKAARLYTEIADIDRHHHHEAMAWATSEREKAAEIGRAMREVRVIESN